MISLPTAWHDRNQYGNIVKKLIQTQNKSYQKTKDAKLKLKLSQNVAYLIQIENSLINDFEKKQEGSIDYETLNKIILKNEQLEKELSEAKHRLEYHPIDSKHEKEIQRFQKLTPKQQRTEHKKSEEDFKRKNPEKAHIFEEAITK